ncbi:MAG: hypothetical protein [Caudoviricetes sp.]|nr:MAG: hypothetical protein [Caudoviricetes sp.]
MKIVYITRGLMIISPNCLDSLLVAQSDYVLKLDTDRTIHTVKSRFPNFGANYISFELALEAIQETYCVLTSCKYSYKTFVDVPSSNNMLTSEYRAHIQKLSDRIRKIRDEN